jgi:hypothetical protein
VEYNIECSKLWQEKSYRDPQTEEEWQDVNFDLQVYLDCATLRFSVYHKNRPMAYTEAKYKENFV